MPIGISAEVTLRLMSMQRLFMYSAFVSLLLIVPVPYLQIDRVDLTFQATVTESLTATVKHRGETVAQVVLDTLQEEKTVTIDGKYHLTVTVTRDGVSVTESDCPGQDCVHTGRITKAGQSIVCLPEQVIVTMEGSSPSPDVILG